MLWKHKDYNFKNVAASQYCEESIRDVFIAGLQSNLTCQRLLENKTLDFKLRLTKLTPLNQMRKAPSYKMQHIVQSVQLLRLHLYH